MEQKQLAVVVAVIKNEKGELLLARRHQPEIPEINNVWEFVGGGVDFGENPEAAMVREVKEESGLDVKIKSLLPQISAEVIKRKEADYQLFFITYECEIIGGELKISDEEIAELKFIPPAEVYKYNSFENVKRITSFILNS